MEKIVEIINTLSSDELDIIINNFNNIEHSKLDVNISNQIIALQKVSSYFKKTELNYLINNQEEIKQQLKLYFIEDWKDMKKINKIKILLLLDSLDKNMFNELVGYKSKKTYLSGFIMDTNALSVEKFFNHEYNIYSKQFYTKLDTLIPKIANTCGIEYNIIKEITDLIYKLIQSEIVCRNKYLTNNLIEYKNKISDIINTRNKEAKLYSLLYEKIYSKMFSHPDNSALKYIMYNEWSDIKKNYLWIAQLITYINNSSQDAKEYLLNLGIIYSSNIKDILRQLIIKFNLNMKNLKEITDFIHNIAENFKHGTYIKWYVKEFNYIELFEQYQNNSLNQNILMLIDKLNISNIELKNQLVNLMLEHYSVMLTMFP